MSHFYFNCTLRLVCPDVEHRTQKCLFSVQCFVVVFSYYIILQISDLPFFNLCFYFTLNHFENFSLLSSKGSSFLADLHKVE